MHMAPPWVVIPACDWASFAHRLMLKAELQARHCMVKQDNQAQHYIRHKLLAIDRQLLALEKGEHLLSIVNRLKFYYDVNGPPY